MTHSPKRSPKISWPRTFGIAGVRIRRVLRTRLALAAVTMSLLPWLLVESASLAARLASLAEFTVVGLTVVAAGSVSDDLDSGEYAIASSHDCSPLDMLAGHTLASFGVTTAIVLLQLPIALAGTDMPGIARLLVSFGWLAALLAGWLGMQLLLATFLEGKSNAVAMIGVLAIVPLLSSGTLVSDLPAPLAGFTRGVLQLLPQVAQVTAMFAAALDGAPGPGRVRVVLLLSPIIYFVLASIRLYRIEPAGRLTQ
jgi:hypothetical protein